MTTTETSTGSFLPSWLGEFYSKFPLVTLEQEDNISSLRDVQTSQTSYSLWIHAPSSSSSTYKWASSDPQSLRFQLLFLLETRAPLVDFQPFSRHDNAPGGELPCLELRDERRLIPANDLRSWFDARFSPTGRKGLQGMPDQLTYDRATAVAALVLNKIYPAFQASKSRVRPNVHLLLPFPAPLAAGLVTPLPASLTGDVRNIDNARLLAEGESALDSLNELLSDSQWVLGARLPTPLDSLIASHLHCLYELAEDAALRIKFEDSTALPRYVTKVMDQASQRMSRTSV